MEGNMDFPAQMFCTDFNCGFVSMSIDGLNAPPGYALPAYENLHPSLIIKTFEELEAICQINHILPLPLNASIV